ncbi:MAG: [acyl-carrier-protein] S-malonyltransferase [Bdellovibrionales bacterium RBG_16_40_8]|nr:MAG: [acyl-carrier-protein] S-malonyltransferase [Bdellovibrionales bacterium RBG_16_40_8]
MSTWGAIFPGQGSQHPGMGQFLYENFKTARLRFEEASDVLKINFKKLCFSGSEEDLQLTKNTQPVILLVSTVTFAVVHELTGFRPIASAGHSVGEYSALVTANSLSWREALKAVRIRGEAMQDAVPVGKGAMCAVLGLTDEQVRAVCLWAEKESGFKPIEPANFNSPGQVVISGSAQAIEWLITNFKKEVFNPPPRRVKFIPLKVSAPFHCSLMKPAEEKMRELLTAIPFSDATNPIVQNFTAEPTYEKTKLCENIIRQISAPVLWTQCVEKLRDLGATRLVEFGSGRVLSGLISKIDSENLQTINLTSLEELKEFEATYET